MGSVRLEEVEDQGERPDCAHSLRRLQVDGAQACCQQVSHSQALVDQGKARRSEAQRQRQEIRCRLIPAIIMSNHLLIFQKYSASITVSSHRRQFIHLIKRYEFVRGMLSVCTSQSIPQKQFVVFKVKFNQTISALSQDLQKEDIAFIKQNLLTPLQEQLKSLKAKASKGQAKEIKEFKIQKEEMSMQDQLIDISQKMNNIASDINRQIRTDISQLEKINREAENVNDSLQSKNKLMDFLIKQSRLSFWKLLGMVGFGLLTWAIALLFI